MKFPTVDFKEANKNLIWIIAVGVALGIANYALGIWPTLGQSLVQQVSISLVIGYFLILIAANSFLWSWDNISDYKKSTILVVLFSLVGIIGSEVDGMVRAYGFQQESYTFLQFSGLHLFNSILSTILGFVTLNWVKSKGKDELVEEKVEKEEVANYLPEKLTTIPIRKGENILLHPTNEILFFEAYDNYAFLFDEIGNKHLCNYSLLFLEKKLTPDFLRVHRKYLINKHQVTQIKPHFKGRFVIEFKGKNKMAITSSSSYTDVIKSLTKL